MSSAPLFASIIPLLLPVLAHIADAAPSNDEMFGWFIVFGLMFLLFLIAWLFGPKEAKTLAEVVLPQRGEGRSSARTNLIVLGVIAAVILYFAMTAGSTPHH